jgi:hypothetical protein
VYALGLILWELRYRTLPFDSFSGVFGQEKMIERIVEGDRPPVRCHDDYDALCSQCWAPLPSSRPSLRHVFSQLMNLAAKESPNLIPNITPLPTSKSIVKVENLPKNEIRWKKEIQLETKDAVICPTFTSSLKIKTRGKNTKMHFPDGEESHHILASCMINERFLWVGSLQGSLFILDMDTIDTDKPLLLRVDPSYYVDRKSYIRSIAFGSRDSSVWTGSSTGYLQVWTSLPLKGIQAVESLYKSGEVEYVQNINQKVTLQVVCGTLTWSWRGWNMATKMKSIPLKFLRMKDTLNSSASASSHSSPALSPSAYFSTLVSQSWTFGLSDIRFPSSSYIFKAATQGDAESWVRMLHLAFTWGVSEWVVMEKASRSLTTAPDLTFSSMTPSQTIPILCVAEIDGNGWTVDGSMRLTEWSVERDLSGKHKSSLNINPKRQLNLDLNGVGLSCVLSSAILHVKAKELWVVTGDRFAVVGISGISLSCSFSRSFYMSNDVSHRGFLSRESSDFFEDEKVSSQSAAEQIQVAIEIRVGNGFVKLEDDHVDGIPHAKGESRHEDGGENHCGERMEEKRNDVLKQLHNERKGRGEEGDGHDSEVWTSNSKGDVVIWDLNGNISQTLSIGVEKNVICAMAQVSDEVCHLFAL